MGGCTIRYLTLNNITTTTFFQYFQCVHCNHVLTTSCMLRIEIMFTFVVFLASGQYTLSMRTYAPFRNVVRSNQRHDSGDEVKFK